MNNQDDYKKTEEKYIKELKKISQQTNYAYLFSLELEKNFVSLEEEEKKIIVASNKVLNFQNDLITDLTKRLIVYGFKDINIYYFHNIISVSLRYKDHNLNYLFQKQNNNFIHINKKNMSMKEKYLGKRLEDYFNQINFYLSNYLNSNYYDISIIKIQDSFINLKANSEGIIVDNHLICPYPINKSSRVLEAYHDLKSYILKNTYISEDSLVDYYPTINNREYKKVLRRIK